MDKMEIEEITNKIRTGQFGCVKISFESSSQKLSAGQALRFVIYCYETTKSKDVDVNCEELCEFLEFVIQYIVGAKENHIMSYLEAIFFIVKYMVDKMEFSSILQMKKVIYPQFLPKKLTVAQEKLLRSICNYTYVGIFNKRDEIWNNSSVEIIFMITELCNNIWNLPQMLCETYKFAFNFSKKFGTELLKKYYLFILNFCETCEVNDEIIISLIKFHALVMQSALKNNEFETVLSFHSELLKIYEIKFNSNNFFSLLELFSIIELMLPVQQKNKSTENIKKSFKLLGIYSEKIKETVCDSFVDLISPLIVFYKTNKEKWIDIPKKHRIDLINFLHKFSLISAQINFECPCKCKIGKKLFESYKFCMFIINLYKISVELKSIDEDIFKNINFVVKNIEELKKMKCEKWIISWSDFGTNLCNIGTIFYHQDNKSCLDFYKCFVKNFLNFEKDCNGGLDIKIVSTALTGFCNFTYKEKDFKLCLPYAALNMFLNEEKRKSWFTQWWIPAKRQLKEQEIEQATELTIVGALEKIITDFPIKPLTNEQKVDLLKFEFTQYKLFWPSKLPMFVTLKEFYSIGNLFDVVATIVDVFGDEVIKVHPDFPSLLRDITNNFEIKSDKTVTSEIYLAFLYFYRFRYDREETVVKHCKEISNIESLLNTNIDALVEECDIICAHEPLKFERFAVIFNYLSKAVQNLSSAINNNAFNTIPKELFNRLFRLLMNIALEYRLQRHSLFYNQTLELALKIAKHENNSKKILQVIGFLVERNDGNSEYIRKLLRTADELLSDDSIIDLKTILIYNICKTKCLIYVDHMVAFESFETIRNKFGEIVREEQDGFDVVEAQLLVLHAKFLLLPCDLRIPLDHSEHPHSMLCGANRIMTEYYKNDPDYANPYSRCILLEVNEELVKFCHESRLPREVRSVGKDTMWLSQNLILPIRYTSYLLYMAYADINTRRFDDCKVKLQTLSDILQIPVTKTVDTDVKGKVEAPVEIDFDGVIHQFGEIMLDGPESNFYRNQRSPSSPSFRVDPLILPTFIKHKSDCRCIWCTFIECQNCILTTIYIEALVHVYEQRFRIAFDFYRGCFKFYNVLHDKFPNYQDKAMDHVVTDLIPDFKINFSNTYGWLLLDYSFHLRRCNETDASVDANHTLITFLKPIKHQHILLYGEALMQRLGYHYRASKEEPEMMAVPETNNELAKTPESKISQIHVTEQKLPNDYLQIPRPKKKIPFQISSPCSSPSSHMLATPGPSVPPTSSSNIKKSARPVTRSTRKKKDNRV